MSDLNESAKCPQCGSPMKSRNGVWSCTTCNYADDE